MSSANTCGEDQAAWHGGDGTSGLSSETTCFPSIGRGDKIRFMFFDLGSGSVKILPGRTVGVGASTNLTEGVSLDMRLASGMYVLGGR